MPRLLTVPDDFDFRSTVWSSGWCVLAPFGWDAASGVLERPFAFSRRGVATLAISQPRGRGTAVDLRLHSGPGRRKDLTTGDWAAVIAGVSHMLRVDADLRPFYARCRAAGHPFDRAEAVGFGRLLRSPTLFEDVVKVLATTNTTWGGTKAMVANLVRLAGTGGAFPDPHEVLAFGAERLGLEARWGYRAAYLHALAEAVVDGRLDLKGWATWAGTTEELEREIRRVPGLGPYAAAHILALLDRHDRIGVDTVFRAFVTGRYFPRARRPPTEKRLLAVYRDWREWRALAFWFDLWYADYADAMERSPGAEK
ncbi:MAG: hypothetical protein ABR559_06840 [Gemmatimonadota bacterium]